MDFHYTVETEYGLKTVDFSIPGGGFVSLAHVVEVLGISNTTSKASEDGQNYDDNGENEDDFDSILDEKNINNAGEETDVNDSETDEVPGLDAEDYENNAIKLNEIQISDATREFVANVESVEFSNPELVWVGKVEEDTTVCALKEANGLEIQYSAELTEEDIEKINSSMVEAGDWALISIYPFQSDESLIITMKDGKTYEIGVTDATYYSITFATEVSPSSNAGTITATSFTTKTGDNNHGTNMNSITAKASSGYTFDHWELDNVPITGNPNITTQADGSKSVIAAGGLFIGDEGSHTLKAVFKEALPSVYNFTVMVDDPSHGTVSGTGADGSSNSGVTSYVAVSKSIQSDGTALNNNSISLTTKVRYQFVKWELRDTDGSVIRTYTNENIAASEITLTKNNLTLVAVFEEKPTTDIQVTEIDKMIDEWVEQVTKETNMLTAEKTAEVYDYDNRIYEIDFTASSGRKVIEPNISLNFITDTSRSMYFPATITETAPNVSNLGNWLSTNQTAGKISTSDVFYVIGDVNNTATMYAVYYSGGWKVTDASYYKADDNKTSTVYDASSITNSVNGKTLTGTIYTSANKPAQVGSLWSRLSYLYKAVEKAAYIIYSLSPDSEIGLTTFNKTAKYEGLFGKTESVIFDKLTSISLDGGTKQDLGLDAARTSGLYSSSSTSKQIAILITDGAPNNTTWDSITTAANNIKALTNANGDNLKLYTLGISLSNVGTNAASLNGISSGDGYHYQADDGAAIVTAIEDMIESLMRKATLQGTVTDTIDSAFYPVYADGTPVQNGATVDGATYTYDSSSDTWTVTWADQDINWPTTESDGSVTPGWHKKVYVKAKEDYLGGNTINTNTGNGNKVTSSKFKTTTGTYKLLSTTDDNGNTEYITYSVNFDSPYVNVNELSFTENETEWTVYLGTSVDPLEQLKQLYDHIMVNEVVTATKDADNDGNVDHKYNDGAMIGSSGENAEQFALKAILDDLDWEQLLAGNAITKEYTGYNHNSGKIVIELSKDIADGEPGISADAHDTAVTGSAVEQYTLTVTYKPYDKDSNVNYHTGNYYSGEEGEQTDNIESINTHVINVFARYLFIQKKDMTNKQLIDTAKFKLYRLAKEENETGTVTTIKVNESDIKVVQIGDELSTSGGEITVEDLPLSPDENHTYYLVETEAPDGYNMLTSPIEMHMYLDDTYTKYLPSGEIIPASDTTTYIAANPYNWTQMINSFLYNDSEIGVISDTKITMEVLNNPGVELPSTGGPGTSLLYLIGLILTAIAGGGLLMKRRRKAA